MNCLLQNNLSFILLIGPAQRVVGPHAAWNKETLQAGLAWTFTGSGFSSAVEGSSTQDYNKSPLVAEALAMRLALIKAATLEITSLRMSSDNLTLIRAINMTCRLRKFKESCVVSKKFPLLSSKSFFLTFLATLIKKPMRWLSNSFFVFL